MDETPKTPTDWEAVEREYRAGQLSIREIAKAADLTEGAIRKRARRDKWERDLSARVREAVRTELVRSEVRNSDPRTEREIVAAAAMRSADVILAHRKDIARFRSVASDLLRAIETDDDKPEDGRMSAKERAALLEQLSRVAVRMIQLERQAFGLDDAKPQDDPAAHDADSPRNEVERRIARLAGS